MAREFPEQRDADGAAHGYADESELSPADRALLESAAGELARDRADRTAGSIDDDDALYVDIGTEPASAAMAAQDPAGSDENAEGLDETEEAVRSQAEDRALGDRKDYIA
jgi:hypothetical protein